MNKAVILQHVAHSGPGRIVPIFRDFGIPIEVRRLYRGDEVPTDLDEVRVLVVLGGPMDVKDIGDERYPFLEKEVEILRQRVEADRPVLGICLGSQLLAHAAGAKVYLNARPGKEGEEPTPAPEFGWGPVRFPFPGGTDPVVMGLMDGAMMFHWHFYTFDLPKLPAPPGSESKPGPPPPTGNVLISSSDLCKNQAYRFRNRLFGFQYHFEMDEEEIESTLSNASDDVKQVLGSDGMERIRKQTPEYYPRHARLGDRILRNFVQFLKLY